MIDIRNLFKEMCAPEGLDKISMSNDSQFEVVEQVAKRVCDEMNALASGDYDVFCF